MHLAGGRPDGLCGDTGSYPCRGRGRLQPGWEHACQWELGLHGETLGCRWQSPRLEIPWHPHGHLLASGSFDRTIRIWDVERGTCLRTLTGHTNWVMGLAFTPDGKLLASGGADNLVKVWEVESGRSQHNL